MKEMICKTAQKGFCAGPVYRIETMAQIPFTVCEDIEEEKAKLTESVAGLSLRLKEQSASASAENAKIIDADRMLLEDVAFKDAIIKIIEEQKAGLSYAVQEGCRELAELLEGNDSDYIRQRAADVRGLGKKLIDIAEGRKENVLEAPAVVAAEELTPQEFAELDGKNILGLITVKGAVSSHVSIMAGNLGIPYVYQADTVSDLENGTCVIVDADAGKVIIDPDEETKKSAEEKIRKLHGEQEKAEEEIFFEIGSPCDGTVIPMEEIADPVFASGALGQAVGVYPSEGAVYAPVSGRLIGLQETKHAFTIETENGKQVLVHVGIDTVKLGGKGFEALAKTGDMLTEGQPVLKIDLDLIRESGYDPTVIVIVLA